MNLKSVTYRSYTNKVPDLRSLLKSIHHVGWVCCDECVNFVLEYSLRWVLASFWFLWILFLTLKSTCWLSKWTGPSLLTCVSVSMREVATSKRLGLDKYLLSLNWFSSSSSCWLVKAVRGLRHFPNKPDWGPAGGGRAKLSVCG